MSNKKRCGWFNDMVDTEKCFASQMPFGKGWYCEICAKPIDLGETKDERNPSQPSALPE